MSRGSNINATCTLYNETDSDYCTEHLQQYTNCLRESSSLNASVDIYIVNPSKAKIIEMNLIKQAFTSLDPRPQCRVSFDPLICLFFIHLCDEGREIGPTKEQCDHVSSVCDKEWEKAKAFRLQHIIDNYLSMCSIAASPFDNKTCNIGTKTTLSSQTLNCSDGFYYEMNEMKCIPECAVWTPLSKTMVVVTDILTVFAAVIGAIAGIAVLLISVVRHQKL